MELRDAYGEALMEYRTREIEPDEVRWVNDTYKQHRAGWTQEHRQRRAAWLAVAADELRGTGRRDKAHRVTFTRTDEELASAFGLRDKVTLAELEDLRAAYLEGFNGPAHPTE